MIIRLSSVVALLLAFHLLVPAVAAAERAVAACALGSKAGWLQRDRG